MPRRAQVGDGEFVYHVMNRGAKRAVLFFCNADYTAFELILVEAQQRFRMRILAYCLMPNHWHFLLRPANARQLSEFMHWTTMTHALRWQALHQAVGTGAVYQGRYKAIPVQTERYFLNVCRYVERNPLRAGLVRRAQEWRWSSLWRKQHDAAHCLEPWPVAEPVNWINIVNASEEDAVVRPIRTAIVRGSPLGDEEWAKQTAATLGLESTLRSRGRPKKAPGEKGSRSYF
jgi:putative transposase